ncbi:MAG: transcription termination factor Rho, partial [Microbacterium sp.]
MESLSEIQTESADVAREDAAPEAAALEELIVDLPADASFAEAPIEPEAPEEPEAITDAEAPEAPAAIVAEPEPEEPAATVAAEPAATVEPEPEPEPEAPAADATQDAAGTPVAPEVEASAVAALPARQPRKRAPRRAKSSDLPAAAEAQPETQPADEAPAAAEPTPVTEAAEAAQEPASEAPADAAATPGEGEASTDASAEPATEAATEGETPARSRSRSRSRSRGRGKSDNGQNAQNTQSGQNGQNGQGTQNGQNTQGASAGEASDADGDEQQGTARGRQRGKRRGQGGAGDEFETEIGEDDVLIPIAGILDVLDNYAFVRTTGYLPGTSDVYVSLGQVKKYNLRKGDAVVGAIKQPREGEQSSRQKYNALVKVDAINGLSVDDAAGRVEFGKLTPLYPQERLRLETAPEKLTQRIIDLVAPIGKGQRGLIVAPPKAGKTIVLQQIA